MLVTDVAYDLNAIGQLYRDRGLAHAEARHAARALQDLETYLANAQEGLDLDAIAQRAAELKRAKS